MKELTSLFYVILRWIHAPTLSEHAEDAEAMVKLNSLEKLNSLGKLNSLEKLNLLVKLNSLEKLNFLRPTAGHPRGWSFSAEEVKVIGKLNSLR